MRRYPVKAGMIDQKLMEKAFLLEVSRLLPHEKYKYTIVADRGFANTRFMSLCREYKFNTDLSEESFEEVLREYKNRFQCEKMFQGEKSSGFEIEKSKIQKYSRFKRLLFCIVEEIRKKYHLHISLISVFSKLQNVY
jgi:hypothetical protein